MGKTLMIGSCEPFSGKSALVLGIARQLMVANKKVRFGKPLATSIDLNFAEGSFQEPLLDDDVRFVGETLGLSEKNLIPSIHLLSSDTADQRLNAAQLESGEEFENLKIKLQL